MSLLLDYTHAHSSTEDNYNVKSTLFDQNRIAEMEFYLVDDLECDLTVFHPYRTLTAICKPDPSSSGAANTGSTGAETETEEGEAIEEDSPGAGVGVDDGPRYWGTGEGQLELPEGGFQHAWYASSYSPPSCSHPHSKVYH